MTYNLEDIQALIGNDSAKAQMEEIINKHNGNMNVIKTGLETGDTADNIVSFTEATTTEGINSGETHATLWGKVKKLFSSLKTIAISGKAKDVGLDDVNKKYTATNVEDAFTEVSQQMEHFAAEFLNEIQTVTLTNSLTFPFNNSVYTVSLTPPRKTLNYDVSWEITSASGNVGDIVVSDKQLNGFKIAFDGSASSVTLKIRIKGGMLV